MDIERLLSLSAVEKAWAAGFIDGEGCILINKSQCSSRQHSPVFSLRIHVTQKIRLPLDKLNVLFGGRIIQTSRGHFEWQCEAQLAAIVLTIIKDYLTVKKEQAELAIEFQRHVQEVSFVGRGNTPTEVINLRESYKARLSAMKA